MRVRAVYREIITKDQRKTLAVRKPTHKQGCNISRPIEQKGPFRKIKRTYGTSMGFSRVFGFITVSGMIISSLYVRIYYRILFRYERSKVFRDSIRQSHYRRPT